MQSKLVLNSHFPSLHWRPPTSSSLGQYNLISQAGTRRKSVRYLLQPHDLLNLSGLNNLSAIYFTCPLYTHNMKCLKQGWGSKSNKLSNFQITTYMINLFSWLCIMQWRLLNAKNINPENLMSTNTRFLDRYHLPWWNIKIYIDSQGLNASDGTPIMF